MKKLLASLLSLALSVSSAQAVPQVLNFQGRLSESGSLSHGNRQITFRIYYSQTGGTALFTEARTIAVSSGIFNALIGEETPGGIPLSVFDGNDRYVEVQVGTTILPRQKMASVAHAFVADQARTLVSGATFQIHAIEASSITASTLRVLDVVKIGTGTITLGGAPVNGGAENSITFSGLGSGPTAGIGGLIRTAGGGGGPGPLHLEAAGNNSIFLTPGGAGLVSITSSLELTGGQAKTISAAAAPLTLTSGGINPLRFNPVAGSGNVGIGLAEPLLPVDKLHLIGQFRIDNDPAAGNSGCFRYNGTQLEFSNDCVAFQSFGGGGLGGSGTPDRIAKFITPSTLGDSVLTETLGNIGIGTPIPSTTLDVAGNAQFGSGEMKSTFTATGALLLADNAVVLLSGPNGTITTASSVTASAFFGDGSGLTNLAAIDPTKVLKTGDTMTGQLDLIGPTGNVVSQASVTASGFFGDGSGLTNVAANDPTKVLKTGDTMTGQLDLTGPTGNVVSQASVTASGFFGDGSGLTNVVANDPTKVLKTGDTMTGDLLLSGVAVNLTGPAGNVVGQASVTASGFFGDGGGLTNVVANDPTKVLKTGDTMTGQLDLTGPTGNVVSQASVTASGFFGDGSGLTGISGPWAKIGQKVTLTDPIDYVVVQTTLTVEGTHFSVGGSLLNVSDGNVGIGTSGPLSTVHIIAPDTDVFAMIIATGSLASQQIVTISTGGVINAKAGVTYAGDLAEMYASRDPIEAGDVVMLDDSNTDGTGIAVRKAVAGRGMTLGVISTEPGMTIGAGDLGLAGKKFPVALSGRVPVKISLENGPIRAGTMLAAGLKPGYAAKAIKSAHVIGLALEDFHAEGNSQEGTVLCFVNLHYWVEPSEFENLHREVESIKKLVKSESR